MMTGTFTLFVRNATQGFLDAGPAFHSLCYLVSPLLSKVTCWWHFLSVVHCIPAVFAEAQWSTQLSFYKRPDRNMSTFSTLGIFESLELAILDVCRVQALNSNSELISLPWFGHQNYLKDSGCHPANMLHFRDSSVSWVCLAIWKTAERSSLSSLIRIAQAPMLSASLAKYTCKYVIHVFCS